MFSCMSKVPVPSGLMHQLPTLPSASPRHTHSGGAHGSEISIHDTDAKGPWGIAAGLSPSMMIDGALQIGINLPTLDYPLMIRNNKTLQAICVSQRSSTYRTANVRKYNDIVAIVALAYMRSEEMH